LSSDRSSERFSRRAQEAADLWRHGAGDLWQGIDLDRLKSHSKSNAFTEVQSAFLLASNKAARWRYFVSCAAIVLLTLFAGGSAVATWWIAGQNQLLQTAVENEKAARENAERQSEIAERQRNDAVRAKSDFFGQLALQKIKEWDITAAVETAINGFNVDHPKDISLTSNAQSAAALAISQLFERAVLPVGHKRSRPIVYSSDGTLVATPYNNEVLIFDADTGRYIQYEWLKHKGDVLDLVFSPDGVHLITLSESLAYDKASSELHSERKRSLNIWSLQTKSLVASHNSSLKTIPENFFSRDSTNIVSYVNTLSMRGGHGALEIIDLHTGLSRANSIVFTGVISEVYYASNNHYLAAVFSSGKVAIIQSDSFKIVRFLSVRDCKEAALSPDGDRALVVSSDGNVYIFNLSTGQEEGTIRRNQTAITHAVFSPDGGKIATMSTDGYADNAVRLWNARTSDNISVLVGHSETLRYIAFSPDSRLILTTSEDHTARIWDARSGAPLEVLRGHTDTVGRGIFSPSGEMVATISDDGTVRLWSLNGPLVRKTLKDPPNYVRTAGFSDGSSYLVTQHGNGEFVIRDNVSGEAVFTGNVVVDENLTVKAFNLSADHPYLDLILMGPRGTLYYQQAEPPELGLRISCSTDFGSPTSDTAATGSTDVSIVDMTTDWVHKRLIILTSDGTLFRLDLTQDSVCDSLERHSIVQRRVGHFLLSPSGTRLIIFGQDSIAEYELPTTETPIWSIAPGLHRGVKAVVFDKQEKQTLIAFNDNYIQIRRPTGVSVQETEFKLDSEFVTADFSADGMWLALLDDHGRVALFDIAKQNLTALKDGNSATALAFGPKDNLLAVAEQGGELIYVRAGLVVHRQNLSDLVENINRVAFSNDSLRFAAISQRRIDVISTETYEALGTIPVGSEHPNIFANANMSRFITTPQDGFTRLWSSFGGTPLAKLDFTSNVGPVRVSSNGDRARASGGVEILWDLKSAPQNTNPTVFSSAKSASFASNGELVTLEASKSGRLSIVHHETNFSVNAGELPDPFVDSSLIVSPTLDWAIATDGTDRRYLLHLQPPFSKRELTVTETAVDKVEFSSDGGTIICFGRHAGEDVDAKEVTVLGINPFTLETVFNFEQLPRAIMKVGVNAARTRMAVVTHDGKIQLREIGHEQQQREFKLQESNEQIIDMGIDPEVSEVVALTSSGKIVVQPLNFADGKVLSDGARDLKHIAFSPDGRHVVGWSDNYLARELEVPAFSGSGRENIIVGNEPNAGNFVVSRVTGTNYVIDALPAGDNLLIYARAIVDAPPVVPPTKNGAMTQKDNTEISDPVKRCDVLASHPYDKSRTAPPVWFEDMDGSAAKEACTAALQIAPHNARILFQLSRALEKVNPDTDGWSKGDAQAAFKYLKQAADSGYVEAEAALGEFYLREFDPEWGLPSDLPESIRYTKRAAEAGDPRGQRDLGDRYRVGQGVEQDYAKAVDMFTSAAGNGDAQAFERLGMLYEGGPENIRSIQEALYWYLRYEASCPPGGECEYYRHRRAALSRSLSPSQVVAEVKRSQLAQHSSVLMQNEHRP
jgi:WD40 repeat protein